MKIFATQQVKNIDRYTIDNEPISSLDLMERAADALFSYCAKIIPKASLVLVFCGSGNNGGDGMALARMLLLAGFNVEVFYLGSNAYSVDFECNLNQLVSLGICTPYILEAENQLDEFPCDAWVIDALYGSGLNRPLSGISKHVVDHINDQQKKVIAIDVPSGLLGEDNPVASKSSVVRATVTLTLQFPKLSFMYAENHCYIGDLIIVPIGLHPLALANEESTYYYVESADVRARIRPRAKFSHKGTFGHSLVIAGKNGMMGAAILAVKGCLSAGAGLVTAHIPALGLPIVQVAIPEAIVSLSGSNECIDTFPSLEKYSAVCVGPGIGTGHSVQKMLLDLVQSIGSTPLLFDADALNILSENLAQIKGVSENLVLTPHPGEFDRLFGKSDSGASRLKKGIQWAQELGVVIVIKGANTQVVSPDGNVYFIPEGNAGMATGGSGDVLAGIVTSLMGQGIRPVDAAIVGAYIHGLAGDVAAKRKGMSSLSASDIVSAIPEAFLLLGIF